MNMKKKPRIAIGLTSNNEETSVSISHDVAPIDMILEIAKKYGIPIIKDENLARQLSQFEMDEELPPELVEAIERAVKVLRKNN